MRLRWVIGLLLLGGAVYFAVFGGEYSLIEVQRIRNELNQERARLELANIEVERLRARVDSLQNDSATIERIARERWGMIRPGERLYRFEEGDSSTSARRGAPPDTAVRN